MNITKIQQIPTNNIFIFENTELINDQFCNELINYINSTTEFGIEKWGINTNVNCKYISISDIKDHSIKTDFDEKIYKIINSIIVDLKNKYEITCTGDSGYCLRKIDGETRLHSDGIIIQPIENRYMSIKKIRKMSIIIALNSEYEGGEFYFPVQDFKIKLKRGQIIAFPPYWTHPHTVSSPINNTYRYTINTWLYE